MELPTISTRHRPRSQQTSPKGRRRDRRRRKFLEGYSSSGDGGAIEGEGDAYLHYSHSATNLGGSSNSSNDNDNDNYNGNSNSNSSSADKQSIAMSASMSMPSTPSSTMSSNNNLNSIDDNGFTPRSSKTRSSAKSAKSFASSSTYSPSRTPKPRRARYYMDENQTVHLRGPPTPITDPKPTTAQLQERKQYNRDEQMKMYQENAHTFAGDLTSLTLTGHIFLQTNYKLKADPLTWTEQYCILDPATKLLSLHDSKTR